MIKKLLVQHEDIKGNPPPSTDKECVPIDIIIMIRLANRMYI